LLQISSMEINYKNEIKNYKLEIKVYKRKGKS
jgi:hypothetical protein